MNDSDQNIDDNVNLDEKIKKIEEENIKKEENNIENEVKLKNEEENNKISEKDLKIANLNNALMRSMADLQNFKRRTEEERSKFIYIANTELILALLPVIDNLQRSMNHLPENLKDNDWVKGILQIHDDLNKTLNTLGIEKIKTVGEKLDPNIHEAIIQDKGEKDVILEEFDNGYMYNGKVIKVAKVKVGNGELN